MAMEPTSVPGLLKDEQERVWLVRPDGSRCLLGCAGEGGGATGPAGATGPVGATGASGASGASGIDGSIGGTGGTGAAGAVGATGPAGATGSGSKFAGLIGDGVSTTIVVAHGLGSRDVEVQIWEAATPYRQVVPTVEATTVNDVTLRFLLPPAPNEYRLVALG